MHDLRTMRRCELLAAQPSGRRLGGVTGLKDESVVVSRFGDGNIPEVVVVGVRDGEVRRLGEGSFPAATTSGTFVVWYAEVPGGADSVALVRQRADGVGRTDTLAHVANLMRGRFANLGSGQWAWWVMCAAPVALDSDWVAFAGVDGSVWRVNAASGARVPMGGKGLIPEFWQGRGHNVLCWTGQGGECVVLNDKRVSQSVRALQDLGGYAQRAGGSSALVMVPGPPRLFEDSWRLVLYDWRDGRMRLVADGDYFSESAVWLQTEVPCHRGAGRR